MSRRKMWRHSAGERGSSFVVCEREPGGMLYEMVWHPGKKYPVYRSLGHRDRDAAKEYAREQAEKLRLGQKTARAEPLTFHRLVDLYLEYRTPKKDAEKVQGEDRRKAALWKTRIESTRLAIDVTLKDWEDFLPLRLTGAIDGRGNHVTPKKRVPVGPTQVRHDGVFLRSVYYWGMSWRAQGGRPLVAFNPFGAPAKGVKSAFELPENLTPRRPIASDDRYDAVLAVAKRVLMPLAPNRRDLSTTRTAVITKARPFGRYGKMAAAKRLMERSYLYELLVLSYWTGRRRGAIVDLWYSDLQWAKDGSLAIRWRPTKHAKVTKVIRAHPEVARVLKAFLSERPGIGDIPLFPSPRKPEQAVDVSTVDEWLLEAEKTANDGEGVPRLKQGRWHPYRRAWATKRKDKADADVMEAGGWKSLKVLKTIYQQSDDMTLIDVIENPRRLEEKKG
jgi:hypothetical protein